MKCIKLTAEVIPLIKAISRATAPAPNSHTHWQNQSDLWGDDVVQGGTI